MISGVAKRVAVIGAGISGVCSAAHLLQNGLQVILFERSGIAGGVWHFDGRSAPDPTVYPNETPSKGDYVRLPPFGYSTPPPEDLDQEKQEIDHAPPGPCYFGLRNNVSTREMRTSLLAWPPGTEDVVSQRVLEKYIQDIAVKHGVDAVTKYHTRVEEVQKREDEWVIRTTTFEKKGSSAAWRLVERSWTFDAVVVASGHYNMPRIPDVPGLKDWKQAWPSRVWHSKRYRNPGQFRDQNVLLIGAGVSSWDVAKEASTVAKHVFQSSRGGLYDLPSSWLPEKTTRVAGVKSFELDVAGSSENGPIQGRVILEDGQNLTEIHSVVLCTGYVTSYPFLPQLHRDDITLDMADDRVLVTSEGNMAHNLHQDIWYIEDTSLMFVGAPYHVATFSLFDFQAQAVARVLSGKAELPSRNEMRRQYEARVRNKGRGREFHSLKAEGAEQAYVADLVKWMNADAARLGIDDKMVGHTDEWQESYKVRKAKLQSLFQSKQEEKKNEVMPPEKKPVTTEVPPLKEIVATA
jgi:thioredoxin reductase